MNNKKRVLLVSPSALNNGGVQYVFMTIVRNLSSEFIFDIVIFNNFQNHYKDEFLSYGGNIFLINTYSNSFFKHLFYKFFSSLKIKLRIKKIFKKNTYDIIHCFNQFDSALFLKKAYKKGIKGRICRSGGCYKKENLLTETIRNIKRFQIKKYATDLTAVSNESGKSFYGEKTAFSILNNPSNDEIVFNSKSPKILTLLQIGMFNKNKNQIFSLEVIKKLNDVINSKINFIGNGDDTKIKNKIIEMGLKDKVDFMENDYNKNAAFGNSTYLIFPSYSESFGNVLIEAQKSGLFCFASDSIPSYANCGGVVYLPLNKGPSHWANVIYKYFCQNNGAKQKFDCSRFTTKAFIENIKVLYLKH